MGILNETVQKIEVVYMLLIAGRRLPMLYK
jgi:hypothetical protein